MSNGDVFPRQSEPADASADEDVFFCGVSDEALERIAMSNSAAAYTGYYWPGSPCTSIGLPCG